MAIIYTQTNSTTGICSGASQTVDGVYCSSAGTFIGTGRVGLAESAAVAGTNTMGIGGANDTNNVAGAGFTIIPASDVSWDAGTWTIRLNITTANMNLTWSKVAVCRVNSSCINQESLGETTGLAISLGTTGVKTATVSGSGTTPTAGDKIQIILVIDNGAMSNQVATATKDQNIDSPFTAVTQPNPNVNDSITVTESVSAMLNPMLFNVFDTVTLTEATQRNMLLFPQPFDEITVTESVNPNVVNNVSVFDTVTLTEDVRAHILVMPFVFDSVTVAEQVTALLTSLNIAADDTVTLTESVSLTFQEAGGALTMNVNDSVTVADDTVRVHILLMPTVSDSVTVTEETQRNMLLFPRPFDSVTVTDVPQMNMLIMPSVFDTVTTAESVTVSVFDVSAVQISAFDSVTVTDNSTVLLPWISIFVQEDVTVVDAGSVDVTGGDIPPEPTPQGTSGGGYYRYFSADEMSCKREIRALEKKEKEVEKQVRKVESKIDDKRDEIEYARNMATLNRLISELTALQEKLENLRRKLEQIEDEEMMLVAFICSEYEQRLN